MANPDDDYHDFYDVKTFHAWDYVVFCLVLGISACIGLYHAFAGGGQRSTSEFLLADRSMASWPVALSVLASFFSASTLLGTPAEVYLRGTQYWMCVWGAMLAPLIGAYLFGPLFHKMGVVSVFEYLEVRFRSKSVRLFGCVLFLFRSTFGMGIVLFGPSVALEEVTGFPIWATIILVGAVCAFYTTLGGMKAVIWSDVFQTGIMLAGMLAAIIEGCIQVGSISKAWEIADQGGRIEFFDFNPDPTVRHTFWTLVVGSVFVWMPPYTVDQQMIQRFSSTRTLKEATWALLLNAPGMFVIITLCSLAGVVMYAFYATCDPMDAGIVTDPNALMPRFVMDLFYWAPGVPGLFVASLFSGALSSVSSMLNSLAAATWEDFIKLLPKARELPDSTATMINKCLAIVYALIGIGYGFLFSRIGGTVLQMSIAFNGAAGAPLVGLFILGAFFPCSNWIGAWVGGLLGFAFPMWVSIGAYVTKPDVMENLNRSTEGCPVRNISSLQTTPWHGSPLPPTTLEPEADGDVLALYTLSYLWYTAAGILVTVIVGILVSFCTGADDPADVDPKLIISYVDKFWCCFPESCRSRLRCGLDYTEEVEEKSSIEDSDEKSSNWTTTTYSSKKLVEDTQLKSLPEKDHSATDVFETNTTHDKYSFCTRL